MRRARRSDSSGLRRAPLFSRRSRVFSLILTIEPTFAARMPRNAPTRFTTEEGRPPRTTAAISRSFSSGYDLKTTDICLNNIDNCLEDQGLLALLDEGRPSRSGGPAQSTEGQTPNSARLGVMKAMERLEPVQVESPSSVAYKLHLVRSVSLVRCSARGSFLARCDAWYRSSCIASFSRSVSTLGRFDAK